MQRAVGFEPGPPVPPRGFTPTPSTEGDVPGGGQDALPGEVAFVSPEAQIQRSVELLGAGAVLVTVPPPMRTSRGRLGDLLEELVERELARLGAPSPYLAAWSAMPEDATARLADQLYRARLVGATGLALVMGTLAAIATPSLTTDDSATLRWLADRTLDSPLALVLDDADLALEGWAAPLPLSAILSRPRIVYASSMMTSLRENEAVEEATEQQDESSAEPLDTRSLALVTVSEDSLAIERLANAEDVRPSPWTGDEATTNDTRVASIDIEAAILLSSPPSVASAIDEANAEPAPGPRALELALEDLEVEVEVEVEAVTTRDPEEAAAAPLEPPPDVAAPPAAVEPVAAPTAAAPTRTTRRRRTQIDPELARERVTVGIPVSGPNDSWRSWAIALSNAKGAQPLAAFERLFAESYVPLANAIAGGLDDPRATRAYDEFRRSFERSYTDAFAAFGATNRRPRLVMDAYDIATKHARLAGARSAHLLVVDSMRYDLGCLVRDRLASEMQGTATLGSETLLWSALPTTTMRQLETLARGMDALRAPSREEPSESLRGRASEVVRRLRVGSRELYKLDLVPAMIETLSGGRSDLGHDIAAALPAIAEAVTEAIARHVATLPPRTLLFVLGDHGFSVDRRGGVQLGGASPEEVLVPAYSYLVGDVH